MKKSLGRKNILKEAGVLLIAAILILTSVVIIPMTVAHTQDHDVGVTEIVSPTSGPMQSYPVEITIENFGTNTETNVIVNVVIEKNGASEYEDTSIVLNITHGASMNVEFLDWTPADSEYIPTDSSRCVLPEHVCVRLQPWPCVHPHVSSSIQPTPGPAAVYQRPRIRSPV